MHACIHEGTTLTYRAVSHVALLSLSCKQTLCPEVNVRRHVQPKGRPLDADLVVNRMPAGNSTEIKPLSDVSITNVNNLRSATSPMGLGVLTKRQLNHHDFLCR